MKPFIIRIIKQLLNDKWTIVLIFIAPLLVMLLVWLILGGGNYKSNIGVFGLSSLMLNNLQKANINVITIDSTDNIDTLLITGKVDAVLYNQENIMTFKLLEADPKHFRILKEINNSLAFLPAIPGMGKFKIEFVYSSLNENIFNSLAYVFLGVVIFFFSFLFSGVSFVRERLNQTLERLLITPVKPYQIVGGYILGYGIISIIQGIIIVLFAVYILNVPIYGSIFLCILIIALLAFSAVAIGNTVSTFTNSELQIMQLTPLILIPQIFFTGLIPLETIPSYVSPIRYIMPLYYVCEPLKRVIRQGAGFLDIYGWLSCIFLLILIVFLLNILSIKKINTL